MERPAAKISMAGIIVCSYLMGVSCMLPITIHRAAMNGDVKRISERVSQGDAINGYDKFGWTPLMWAVYYNQLNAVKYLLSGGADANAASRDQYGSFVKGTSPLMLCAYYDYRVLAKLLIGSGADIQAKDSLGNTACTFAELNNLLEMLALLENAAGKNLPKGGTVHGK